MGKTALAVHWAHQIADQFPDGQLHVNLRGFDPTGAALHPATAIRRFLDALSVPPHRIPADPDAQTALYRSELARRRMLIVLDNARDTSQVRPLLPGAPGCLVLVTSRNQLSGLIAADGACPISLDLLSGTEAHELLARRLGLARLAAEPQAVEDIIARCARLPLALAIVAARAASHPHLPLHILANELQDASSRLGVLSTDDPTTDVRAVFSWSYHALTPDTARLFRLLGLHPGPDISAPAAAIGRRAERLATNGNRRALVRQHRLLLTAWAALLGGHPPPRNLEPAAISLHRTYANADDMPGAGNCTATLAVVAAANHDLDRAQSLLSRARQEYSAGRPDHTPIPTGQALITAINRIVDRMN